MNSSRRITLSLRCFLPHPSLKTSEDLTSQISHLRIFGVLCMINCSDLTVDPSKKYINKNKGSQNLYKRGVGLPHHDHLRINHDLSKLSNVFQSLNRIHLSDQEVPHLDFQFVT